MGVDISRVSAGNWSCCLLAFSFSFSSFCLLSSYIVFPSVDAAQAWAVHWRKRVAGQCLNSYWSVGVCAFPRLPESSAQSWECGNGWGPPFGELQVSSGQLYARGNLALPFSCLRGHWDAAATVTEAAPVQNSPSFWNPSLSSLQPWFICHLGHYMHFGISCWGFCFLYSLSRNYRHSHQNQLLTPDLVFYRKNTLFFLFGVLTFDFSPLQRIHLCSWSRSCR